MGFPPMNDPDPVTLLVQTSPYGQCDAIVEQDGRTVYFYLQAGNQASTRACWVANLQTGPLEFHPADLQGGRAPLLPRLHCLDPRPSSLPDPATLEVVWFEAGDGAALLQGDRPLAVIPPWSGQDGFHGYAANCASENLVCWPLPERELLPRIGQARQFWRNWVEQPPFRVWQPAALKVLQTRFGAMEQYYAVEGNQFPPRGVAQLRSGPARTLVTVGMSLCPQPTPLADDLPPNWLPHLELAIEVPADTGPDRLQQLAGRLASLSSLPWRNRTWLGAGHSCDWLPDAAGQEIGRLVADDRSRGLVRGPWSLPEIPEWISPTTSPGLVWIETGPRTSLPGQNEILWNPAGH